MVVGRKLAELGYKRSAKKCKEKFENVHKYYKRTKEGRAGRQDGKSYKFFTQLEALHNTTTTVSAEFPPQRPPTTAALDVAPVSVGIISNMPASASVVRHNISPATIGIFSTTPTFPVSVTATPPATAGTASTMAGMISFSTDGSSSSPTSEDDDEEDEEEDLEGQQPSSAGAGGSRKRKRQQFSGIKGETRRMMEFFESLMKQVMQKQEAMQQRFLEAIDKREQDRMIREEAWKRQEMARLSREHELMGQERAISASRDAAIVALLQKITGQTIQLPSIPVTAPPVPHPQPAAPPPPPQVMQLAPVVTVSIQPPPTQIQQTPPPPPQQHKPQQRQQKQPEQAFHHRHESSDVIMATPEQQVPPQQEFGSRGSGSHEPPSSRWPKPEVLALIKFRSGLESRYQEAGPKGPLWEEISRGMQRMGYKRSAKRCKEKWENINKYFKKVKESNKKPSEDSKTCPYYHQLDELYQRKIIGGSSSSSGGVSTSISGFVIPNISPDQPQQQQQPKESINLNPVPATMAKDRSDVPTIQQSVQASESPQNKNGDSANVQSSSIGLPGSLFEEGNGEGAQKPEDIIMELMKQQGTQQQHDKQSIVNDCDRMEVEAETEKMNREEGEDDQEEDDSEIDEEDDDEELQGERKMAYKIEFQSQNTSASSNGEENGAPSSFLTLVQ